MRLFTFLAILKYVDLPLPPWSMLEKVGWIFSFQSITQHWIGGEGGIYAVVSIIFAPDSIACKNNETFHIFGHFKVRRPPPCPHDQCWKKWVEFSLFSHPHNIELGVRGAFMRMSQ
jgi:hypothetical protein